MYCQKCGAKNNDDSQFCMDCGEKLISVDNQGSVQAKEASSGTKTDITTFIKSFTQKIGSRNIRIAGIVSAVLVLVLIFSSFLGSGESDKVLGLLYVKDGELHITNNDEAGDSFSDEDHRWKGLSGEKRNYIYFLDEYDYNSQEGDLKLQILGKEIIEIEDDVYVYYTVSPSGRRTLLMTDYDGYTGTLHLSVDGKKPEEIAEDVSLNSYVFGEDETEILYISDFDSENYTGTLYYKKEGKDAVEIDDEASFPIFMRKGGKEVYFAKEYDYYEETFDLYLKSGKDNAERISKGITSIVFNKDYGKAIEITQDDDWEMTFDLRKNNEDAEEIDDKITYVDNIASITQDTMSYYKYYYGSTRILHTENEDLFAIYAEDDDKFYVFKEGYKPVKLMDYEDMNYITTDAYCNVIAFIDNDNNTLYTTTFKNGELTEPHEIDNDVYDVRITQDGKSVVYLKDYNDGSGELLIANINGEPEEIADDVTTDFRVSKDAKEFMFIDEDDTLFYARRGKDPEEVAEDVYYFDTIDFKAVYYTDYDEEFFKIIVGKEPVSIDDDVRYFYLLGDIYN